MFKQSLSTNLKTNKITFTCVTPKTKTLLASNWLQTMLVSGENGIIFEKGYSSNFEEIQNFIESIDSIDHDLKTSVIYYRAFAQETAGQFLNTLSDELVSKLGFNALQSNQSLIKTIRAAALKMVIIEESHLHPLETIDNLVNFFGYCGVSLILVGSQEKMAGAPILSHPQVSQWEQFIN